MKRNDWIGLGASLALHGLLLLLFTLVSGATTEPERFGYVEVDFGPLSQGRPVERALEEEPVEETATEPEPEEPEPEPEPEPTPPPEEAKPVELPDQPEEVIDEEEIETPETEDVSPEEDVASSETETPELEPEPEETIPPPPGGQDEAGTGEEEGGEGEGAEETEAAPFDIEGLNREPVATPLPRYAEQVNATIRVSITVDPSGRIVRRIPLLKGNPSLEQSVMDVLQRWRFNPLPANAPQENQTGVITFRFRLE